MVQEFGCGNHILHSRIEPQVVAVGIEDHWHAVLDG
jgi:hypothetical protein